MFSSRDDSLVCVYMTKQEAALYSHFSDYMKGLQINITPHSSLLENPMDKVLNDWITHIDDSFDKADKYISAIDTQILNIYGMSGKKTRHFYNNLASKKDVRYLEIGVLTGSSTCAMISNNNTIKCVAIDNWSEFGGPKNEFLQNIVRFKGTSDIKFIEANCWTIDTSKLGKFNMYLYDGPHSELEHYEALHYYSNCLDDIFVYIIDDWNWDYVRNGTLNAITTNKFNIKYKREIRTTNDNTHPSWEDTSQVRAGPTGDWHNGICVFILSKY
jgi:hypothetical protein